MSEASRPRVDLGLMQNLTQEEVIAQEAFELLMANNQEIASYIDGFMFRILETEAADLGSKDDNYVSVRLKSMPVLIIDEGNEEETHLDAANYYVINIDHRPMLDQAQAEQEVETGQLAVDWTTYIRLVIDTRNCSNVHVLDGETFEPLNYEELGFATFLLSVLRQEFRDANYDENLRDTAEAQARLAMKLELGKYVQFDSTDFMQTSACGHTDCSHENEPCTHNSYTIC